MTDALAWTDVSTGLAEKGVVVFRMVVGSPGFDVDAWHTAIRRHLGVPSSF